MSISQPFDELQGLNLELNLITTISITGRHIGTMMANLDFSKVYSYQITDQLKGLNSELRLIATRSIICSNFGTIAVILDFVPQKARKRVM